jgi:hypothetical protein
MNDGWRNSNGQVRRDTMMLNGKIGRSRVKHLDILKPLVTFL